MEPSQPPDDEIDRKSLRALRERFLALNRERLEALRLRLKEEQRSFVDALPLLLHSNHAALPGFVDFEMPCGIDRYIPDRRAINAVHKIALSFVQERFVERRLQIQAVYVTALPGDRLEVGVCSAFATHAALKEKLARLVRYGADHGVALQTLLLDPAEEQAGRSRLRTPHLARDAFYRSAILLAGRYPVWWLVPPALDDAHEAYCARLKAQRFIGRDEALDLGRAETIPPAECLIAGVDLLEAALTAPYAHLPSLILLESYANGSSTEPLAHFYKERIWRGDSAADSSALLDESISAYLTERGEMERLTLARDCRRPSTLEPTITQLQRENTRVNTELQHAYLQLMRLASDPTPTPDALVRLAPIGKQIAQLAGRRDGAISGINPALWPKRVAGMVRLEAHDGAWHLHEGNAGIFTAPRLAAVIAWAHLNRLGLGNLRIADAHRHACARMLELLAQHAHGKSLAPSTLLIINAEDSPQLALKAQGDAIVSDWDDSLDFSGFHTSLVAGIDVLEVREDGISPRGYQGDDGLIAALLGLLAAPAATLHVRCVGGERDRAIEERVATLAAHLTESFLHDDGVGRFAFALADGFVVIERAADRLRAKRCANEASLFEALATPGRHGRNLRIDPRSARLGALRQLCGIARHDRDTLLIHERRGSLSVLLAMRDGSMHRFDPPSRTPQEIADDLFELFAEQRDTETRAPDVYLARASDAPHRVVERASKRGSGNASANVGVRRNVVAMLREKFASQTELARRPTVA